MFKVLILNLPHFLELNKGVIRGEGKHVGQSKFMLLHLVFYLQKVIYLIHLIYQITAF